MECAKAKHNETLDFNGSRQAGSFLQGIRSKSEAMSTSNNRFI